MKTNLILLGKVIAEKYRLRMEGIYPKVKLGIAIQRTVFPLLLVLLSFTMNGQSLNCTPSQMLEYTQAENEKIVSISDVTIINGYNFYTVMVAGSVATKTYYFRDLKDYQYKCYMVMIDPYSGYMDGFVKLISKNTYVGKNTYYVQESGAYFYIDYINGTISIAEDIDVARP
jgi:hypothetical protein